MKKLLMFFAIVTLVLVFITGTVKIIAHVDNLSRTTGNMQVEFGRINEQQLFLVAAFCNQVNMGAKKPQELSHDQCLEYARNSYLDMKKAPTATPLQRQTTRRGLGMPELTPCSGELPCGNKAIP